MTLTLHCCTSRNRRHKEERDKMKTQKVDTVKTVQEYNGKNVETETNQYF